VSGRYASRVGAFLQPIIASTSSLDGFIAFAAEYFVFFAGVIVLATWLHPKGLRAVIAMTIGAVVGLLVGSALSHLWDEARPFVAGHYAPLVPHSADASFPSDHLIVLGAIAAGARHVSRLLGIAGILLAVIVATARVYAGLHYWVDVVGGFALGYAFATVGWWATLPLRPLLSRADSLFARGKPRPG